MKRSSYSILLAVFFILSSGERTALGFEGPQAVPDCEAETCKKSWMVPVARIAALEFCMHAGMLAIWNDSFDMTDVKANRRQFELSWTSPPEYESDPNIFATDGDWWYFNLIAHGVFGSETYLAARIWKHEPLASFLFSAAASFMWEYLIEGWYKQPSAIDLFWTPAAGILLGELRYQGYLAAKKGISSRPWRGVVLVLLDPLGELERLILGCEI